VMPPCGAESKPWLVKSWSLEKASDLPETKRVRWQTKRPRTDASKAPRRPLGVHMVCMSASDSKDGGCGCRQQGEPLMEHNGMGRLGEWHVVTQPHFNCPRGSFRPAVFVTSCAAGCYCPCHMAGSGVDPADCKCSGSWRRATAEEWVKTTTAPTANSWKDRRIAHQQVKAAAKMANWKAAIERASTAQTEAMVEVTATATPCAPAE